MAASQASVETGGKSPLNVRISVMGTFLHHLGQIAERGGLGGLGVDEKDSGSARALARRLVDDLEASFFEVVERLLNVGHAQCNMSQAAAAAVLLDLFGNRRFRRQRLQ